MGRYRGTLHKLVEQGPLKKGNWNLVLNYLEGHAVGNRKADNPPFASPLPNLTAASPDLERELLSAQGPKQDETPLRIATLCKSCPSQVLAALCHLCPEAARLPDGKSRIPLHWACRRPTTDKDSEQALITLVKAYPSGLIHRDDGGRTPLHYLFWYHANTRSVKLVQHFLQEIPLTCFVGLLQINTLNNDPLLPPLPTIPRVVKNCVDTPATAAIIYDAKHGALPIHYAVMEGASKEVIKILLQNYPTSKALVDRHGRTALAWYFGAGEGQHISGESPDPGAIPLYDTTISSNVVNLLLASKVARMVDDTGRTPLHWACSLSAKHYYMGQREQERESTCISIRTIQMLMDHFADALLQRDIHGKTPLHLLFDVVADQQEIEWQRLLRNQLVRPDIDLRHGQAIPVYEPPSALVELLLVCPDSDAHRSAATVEDKYGRLPLHAALATGTSAEVIKIIIQSHPTALVHTTDLTLQTPLHAALAVPFTAPLQTEETILLLLQAYVTSRHGTFVNGKLALKLDDANGMYPLHYACQNQACLNVLSLLANRYPRACKFQNGVGDLPVHCLLAQASFFGSTEYTIGASLATPMGWMSQVEESFRVGTLQITQEKLQVVLELLAADEASLALGSFAHGMLPLHIAIAFDALPLAAIYTMVETYPKAILTYTTAPGHSYSPLDLHDMRRPVAKDENRWNQLCELLFAYGPTIETHRHKDELLEQCAQLIREEVTGNDSPHIKAWIELQEADKYPPLDLTETLSSIEAPEIDAGCKPKSKAPRSAPKVSSAAKKIKKKKKPGLKSPVKERKQSIYDDDGGGCYVMSAVNSDDDDDDDEFTDGAYSDEEYDSEDESQYDIDTFDDGSRTCDDHTNRKGRSHLFEVDDSSDDNTLQTGSRTFDDETTLGKTFDSKDVNDNTIGEENNLSASPSSNILSGKTEDHLERPFMSPVAMRLFTYFMLYRNPFSVQDNYSRQVDIIFDALDFTTAKKLLALDIDSFGRHFVRREHGATLGDAANNCCRAVTHKAFHFIGRYEFPEDGLLLHKSGDNQTVLIRAVDHVATVVEVSEEPKETPGGIEAVIWETGNHPEEAPVYKWTTFSVTSRKVYFKFMKSRQAYEREVVSRQIMGVAVEEGTQSSVKTISPLIDHYNSLGQERKSDLRYKRDVEDERFNTLQLAVTAGIGQHKDQTLILRDYPFALVLPFRDGGSLFDHFLNHGEMSMAEIREVGAHIGHALTGLHEKGLVHGNVSVHNITSVVAPMGDDDEKGYWTLAELSSTCQQSSDSFMAGIDVSGVANFSTGTFPPELFTKLTLGELGIYNHYWSTVQSYYNISIDSAVVSPQVDPATGESYVLKCHFMGEHRHDLPPLPYLLVPVRETADIWSFGKVLFMLCSFGHPLFSTNVKSGHVLAHYLVANWNHDQARALVYKNVNDPLAQDLLLHLLTTFEDRSTLQMETILSHPFFTQQSNDANVEKVLNRIVEQRSIESRMYIRSQDVKSVQQAGVQWLTSRTKSIVCWDLEFQNKMLLSPSNLIKLECTQSQTISDMPLSLLVLPYKLLRNKSGKLTPSTKKDVERAERMGIQLLSLSKACYFAGLMEQVVDDNEGGAHKWSSSEVSAAMALSSDDFKELEEEMSTLAAHEVELFRDNPLHVARRIIQSRIKDVQACFDESKKAFLYFVDEFEGIPIVELDTPYPHESSDGISRLVQNTLPLMHMSILYMRGVAGSVAGLVKLIFEAAHPHIPPSWSAASGGMEHVLNKDFMMMEVALLRSAIADLYGIKRVNPMDNLEFLQSYLKTFDPLSSFSNLNRVTNGESSMWTSEKGMEKINQLVSASSIEKARNDQAVQREALILQEMRIAELELALENMSFRNTHELDLGLD